MLICCIDYDKIHSFFYYEKKTMKRGHQNGVPSDLSRATKTNGERDERANLN